MGTSLVDFIAISIPEQFMMALFVWVIVGKKETAPLKSVVLLGVISAVVFRVLAVPVSNYLFSIIPQVLVFVALIYFIYKVNIVESIISCLVTMIIFVTVQGFLFNVVSGITGVTDDKLVESSFGLILFAVQYFVIIGAIVYIIYRLDINIRYLGKKDVNKFYVSRVRFLILQLAFSFLHLILIYTIVVNNIEFLKNTENIVLVAVSVVVTVIFTLLVIKSVFKMGKLIQSEEEQKRQYDGIEIIQNINYLHSLVENRKYLELKSALESMKDDIDNGMVKTNNKANK
ncbi:hypothetical protein RBH29_17405 [Herbivorax sp. ANBcel31]|uniref:hypothetical protein n=1 Tax=Herbivorax sp. ANBcel31 TaxID=3069754 RepID=UPI0027B7D5F8|nr:hypothetical protein [Herbivorax sp. ANBcel31]MDQ2088203.1 hypothetical protein [Herbivorax sp. ANBcel31]